MIRLMIVDDEAIIATQLEEILTTMGYAVVGIATGGKEAVSMALDCKPDLILMDIKLPDGTDGIEAATMIRESRPIPVIFMTAYPSDEYTLRAKALGPYGYLPKPFHPDYFKPIIEIALHKHRLEQELDRINNHLETLVQERTDEIRRINEKLREQIGEQDRLNQKLREKEARLEKASENLEESNRALARLAEKRRQDLIDVEMDVIANVRDFVLPYIEKLKSTGLTPTQAMCIDIIETNLKEVTSPFISRRSPRLSRLSGKDLQIYQLIRQGQEPSKIAEFLNVSPSKVSQVSERFVVDRLP
ncbi:response regulator [Desulfatirhabdium butyrativorans]|uniref:response regulator n=1 Tax=Desulfatirhabdium butyrativorans TaxID=340467 RepID=UPI00041BED65|nr:response regulator [Desulfatirhabdium butyrativorans]